MREERAKDLDALSVEVEVEAFRVDRSRNSAESASDEPLSSSSTLTESISSRTLKLVSMVSVGKLDHKERVPSLVHDAIHPVDGQVKSVP